MGLQLATIDGTAPPTRSDVVKDMAEHLVAAIIGGGLDTSSDVDVIECLRNTPARYHYRQVLDNMDSALYAAKQLLIAVEMGR